MSESMAKVVGSDTSILVRYDPMICKWMYRISSSDGNVSILKSGYRNYDEAYLDAITKLKKMESGKDGETASS